MGSDSGPQNASQPIPRKALALFHLGLILLGGGSILLLIETLPNMAFHLHRYFGVFPTGWVGFGVVLLAFGLLTAAFVRLLRPISQAVETDTDQALRIERNWPVTILGVTIVAGLLLTIKTVFSLNGFFKAVARGTMFFGILLYFVGRSWAHSTS